VRVDRPFPHQARNVVYAAANSAAKSSRRTRLTLVAFIPPPPPPLPPRAPSLTGGGDGGGAASPGLAAHRSVSFSLARTGSLPSASASAAAVAGGQAPGSSSVGTALAPYAGGRAGLAGGGAAGGGRVGGYRAILQRLAAVGREGRPGALWRELGVAAVGSLARRGRRALLVT
jgi:hypothetical protein